jgi:hypothetical protein
MATAFKKGDEVKVIAVYPRRPSTALRMDEDGNFFYLVEWTDADGNVQQRWFEESQLVCCLSFRLCYLHPLRRVFFLGDVHDQD